MAVIYSKIKKGRKYEIRTAGASIRLYTDGVFHSQWNPSKPLSGHLWDLLFLPVCFAKNVSHLDDVLVLGLGGGAVINLFDHFCLTEQVTAVDLDKEHIRLSKKYFLNKNSKHNLVHDSAENFVKKNKTKYQIIVEDLFAGLDEFGEACRAVKVTRLWLESLLSRLQKKGILVFNFESSRHFRQSLPLKLLREHGVQSVYELKNPKYENSIVVCSPDHLSRNRFYGNIKKLKAEFSANHTQRLSFSMRRML